MSSVIQRIEEKKARMGELLLQHTELSQENLNEALEIQSQSGELLGEILLEKGFIQQHDITKVVCLQTGIPYQDTIEVDEIDPNLTTDIPINYAKSQEVLPILNTDYNIVIAVSDPFNFDVINDLQEIFKKEIKLVVCPPAQIENAINRVYERGNRNLVDGLEDEFDESMDLDGPIDILDAGADEAPVIRFVNSIIFRAVRENASDIHIEPYERETIYRFRINGVMTEILRQPIKTHAAVSARIKVMAKLDIAEKRLPQDGRIKIKIAGKDVDVRLSTVPIQMGERVVMRVLQKSSKAPQLEDLGYYGTNLEILDELSKRKHGVVYVSGPTGSGKTTTLFAMLARINSPDKMIITVEDPVEYEIPGVSQIQVNHKIELSFARALRAIVRQDPDVIMVGETRDLETAQMAIEASLTGHFVLSTIHTNDASSAPNRLIDMGVQPFLIASSLAAVLAQRLIQTLCSECKEPHQMTQSEWDILGIGGPLPQKPVYKAKGCAHCNFRGYAGRTTVSELLVINDEIRPLILQKAPASTVKKKAMALGMKSLRQDAIYKVLQGITSVEEVARVINDEGDEGEENH